MAAFRTAVKGFVPLGRARSAQPLDQFAEQTTKRRRGGTLLGRVRPVGSPIWRSHWTNEVVQVLPRGGGLCERQMVGQASQASRPGIRVAGRPCIVARNVFALDARSTSRAVSSERISYSSGMITSLKKRGTVRHGLGPR